MQALAQRGADGRGQARIVQRVEVELTLALGTELAALLHGSRDCQAAACCGILLWPVEERCQLGWNGYTAVSGKSADPLEIGDRHNSGHDGYLDPGCPNALGEAQEDLRVEEELRNSAGRAGVEFALQEG